MHTTVRTTAILVILAMLVFPIGACTKAKRMSAAGTYVSERNTAEYRELKSDGTCFLQGGDSAVTGTYEIEGNQVTIKGFLGITMRAKLEGNTMIDSQNGERWTKK
jgi:hypothetical protein